MEASLDADRIAAFFPQVLLIFADNRNRLSEQAQQLN